MSLTPAQMVAQIRELRKAVPIEMAAAATEVGARGVRLLREGYLSGARLRVRSGRLRGTASSSVTRAFGSVALTVTVGRANDASLSYARIQEDGGTITPKRGRFLAIPVGPALTAAGVARYSSPRDVPGLRFQPIHGGAMGRLVKDTGGKRGRSETWFLLVPSVKIKGTHYMRDAGALMTAAFPGVLSERLARRLGA